MIEALCPECKRPLSLPDDLAAKTVRCPSCLSNVTIPPQTPAAFAAAPPALTSAEFTTQPPAPVAESPNSAPVSVEFAAAQKRLEEIKQRLGMSTVRPGLTALPAPTKPLDRRKVILLLCGWPIAVFLGAYMLAGGGFWIIAGITASVVGGFMLLILLLEQRKLRLGWSGVAGAVVYAIILEGMWWWIGYYMSRSNVYVDNFSNRAVRAELDGRPWLTCKRDTTAAEVLHRGRYHLVVRAEDNNEVLDERDVFVDGLNRIFVLNLLGAETYYRGSVQYGGIIGFGDNPPTTIHDVWFNADVDFLFQDPPSSITVSVPNDQPSFLSMENKTYLTRGKPPSR